MYVLTLAAKQIQQIVDARNGLILDYEWSPKENFISYSTQSRNGMSAVDIWNSADSKNYRVTPEMFNASDPAWDPNGNYLYFISSREFAPQISNSEFNYATNRMGQIYALALRTDVKNPFPYESDEVSITEEKKPEALASPNPSSSPETRAADNRPERIDFSGIEQRVTKVPLPADNYAGLSANKGHLVYLIQPPFYYGRNPDTQSSLRIYSLKERKETTLLQPAGGYGMSSDGSKLFATSAGSYVVLDANPNGDKTKKNVSTAGLVTEINPAEEWNQMFNEVWRRYRDWFYAANMHGFEWKQIRDEYKKWLPYVNHRSDLNYLLSEMQSELTVQHAYIDGGDFNLPPRVRVALAGAKFEADKAANRYRISKTPAKSKSTASSASSSARGFRDAISFPREKARSM